MRNTATANINSHTVAMVWTLTAASPPAVQGWIGGPLNGSTVTGIVPITVGAGVTLTQGTVEYWPATNPSAVTVLAASAQGGPGATLATLDTTLLANGNYVVRPARHRLDRAGARQPGASSPSPGENKPGRVTLSVTDLTVPVAGHPDHHRARVRQPRTQPGRRLRLRLVAGDGGAAPRGEPRQRRDASPSRARAAASPSSSRRTSFGFPFSFLYQPTYTPEPGVYGKLASDGCGLLIRSSGGVACFLSTDPTYRPTVYAYTDPYGRVYTMTAAGQARSRSRTSTATC